MKKDVLMIFSCLGLLSLAACGSSNDGSNVPDFVYQEIALASSSYKMRAQENEKISKINGETMVENVFQYDVTNVRGDKPAIQKTISQTTSSGFSSSSFSYIKGERGYIAEETLDYKNEVVEMEALDEDGNKVIYDHEFASPFSFLTKGDLLAVEGGEGRYRISDDKKQLFARYLFVPGYQIVN